jgi:hypothetical protein
MMNYIIITPEQHDRLGGHVYVNECISYIIACKLRLSSCSMILFASACPESELGVCSYPFLIHDTVVPVHDVSCKCLLAVPPV